MKSSFSLKIKEIVVCSKRKKEGTENCRGRYVCIRTHGAVDKPGESV